MNFKQTIEDIKNRSDIVSAISEYVQLKKRGKNYIGLCPFHSEKTPSFTVSQEKSIFHCFGCGEGGNIFDFLMKIEKIEFIEALKMLGEKVGVPVELKQVDQKIRSEKQKLLNINLAACKFFEENLDNKIVDYFTNRGIDQKTVKDFKIGFAKDGWDNLFKYLVGRGFDPGDVEKTGLIIKKENNKNEYFDRFRNRIIFPIVDKRERVLGFSGRAFGDFEPKYLNSPDSTVFHKGETLFGLNLAENAIRQKKYIILVEGNVDVMMCHKHGFENTVASLGTAFTGAQAKLLKRLASTTVIAFDPDEAGQLAAERSENQFKEVGIGVRIAEFEDDKDPADFLKDKGKEAFLEILKNSPASLEFKLKRIAKKFNLSRPESKARAIAEAAKIISREKNQIIQDEYIKYSADLFKVNKDSIFSEVKRAGFYKNKKSSRRSMAQKPPSKREEAEKFLIHSALEDPEIVKTISDRLKPEDFSNPSYSAIMEQVISHGSLRVDENKTARELLLNYDSASKTSESVSDCINTIKKEKIKKKQEELRLEIKNEDSKGNIDRVKELQTEFSKLGEIFRSL